MNDIKRSLIILTILLISTIFTNCINLNKDTKPTKSSDFEAYSKGIVLLEQGNYLKATDHFDEVFLNYPFSPISSKAEIMTAYSLYQNNEIKKAINKLNSYIEMNPTGKLTEYAHYLLAMCYYTKVSNEGRDPSLSEKALSNFNLIITKYPNSKYAKDARLKIQYIKNSLARNELNIGKFYLKKKAPASSIKRFKLILEDYQNTTVIPETLYRLSEALITIGLKEEAKKSSAILNYNFPNNSWSKLSKKLFIDKSKQPKTETLTTSITDYLKKIFD